MQITLKKARKVQVDLKALATAIETSDYLRVSAFNEYSADKISADLATKQAALNANIKTYTDIIGWIYDIRMKVAVANTKVGIDVLMTQNKYADEVLGKLNPFIQQVKNTRVDDPSIVVKRLDIIKTNLENAERSSIYSRAGQDEIQLSVLPSVEDTVKALKQQKMRIEDQLTALNALTKIDLSDDLSAYLQAEGIA